MLDPCSVRVFAVICSGRCTGLTGAVRCGNLPGGGEIFIQNGLFCRALCMGMPGGINIIGVVGSGFLLCFTAKKQGCQHCDEKDRLFHILFSFCNLGWLNFFQVVNILLLLQQSKEMIKTANIIPYSVNGERFSNKK
jgi:hypothetical protein